MRRTYPVLAVATACLLAGCSAGSSRAGGVAPQTAQVTVGRTAITSHSVSCKQVQWLMTVNVGSDSAHVQAVLDLNADKPKPESVSIENLGGFTGVANALVGKADATFSRDTYRITGEAEGSDPDRPGETATAPFTIEVSC